jgi:hypothetical protein
MVTVADYLAAALVRNRKTQEKAMISEDAPEAVAAFNRALRAFFIVGARVNPAYFGKVEEVSPASGHYPRPADAELVYRMELTGGSDGELVHRVHVSDQDAEVGPRVYRWGRVYVPVEGVAGDLRIFYSARPAAATTLASEVDPLWEDHHAELLVLELAAWLAHRDERWDELGALLEERNRWLQLFVSSLVHESVGETVETGHEGLFATPTVAELQELLLARPGGG